MIATCKQKISLFHSSFDFFNIGYFENEVLPDVFQGTCNHESSIITLRSVCNYFIKTCVAILLVAPTAIL